MPSFSEKSLRKLATCHPDLQRLFHEVIKYYDCVILCGHRNQKEQEEAYKGGFSKKTWPNSKHNLVPSLAVDVVPYPVPEWTKTNCFVHFAGFVLGIARKMYIPIRWGGDFNMNNNITDDSFVDMPHFELLENVDASIK